MAHARAAGVAQPAPLESDPLICHGRTCLQWRSDGELADPDRQLVLARLGSVDAALAAVLARQDAGPADSGPVD